MSENSSDVNITKYFENFQNFPNQKFSTDQAYFRCDLNDIESNDLFSNPKIDIFFGINFGINQSV